MKYTEQELEFLKNHYPTYGGKYCQSYLKNRSIDAINAIASRLGLKIINKQVHPDLQAISITNFNNIDKNTAYFLGYFWADGYIYNYVSNNINNWRIILEIQEEDAISILPIMNKLGKWSIQKRKRNNTWKTTWSFVTNNKELYNFLLENDYRDKSILEPTKILKLIPENLHNYFWKGSIEMGKAENWQQEIIEALSISTLNEDRTIILNPRRKDWDSSWKQSISNTNFREQVEWELCGIEDADLVIFYFDPNTQSPITLMELGTIVNSNTTKAIVCCPNGYWRKGNVEVFCEWAGIDLYHTKEEFLEDLKHLNGNS